MVSCEAASAERGGAEKRWANYFIPVRNKEYYRSGISRRGGDRLLIELPARLRPVAPRLGDFRWPRDCITCRDTAVSGNRLKRGADCWNNEPRDRINAEA
jgi:hypothetical protein